MDTSTLTPSDVQQKTEELFTSYLAILEYYRQEQVLVDQLVDLVLTDEQRQEIAAIRERFAYRLQTLEEQIKERKQALEVFALQVGKTVEFNGNKAVYNKGRVTWDSKGLDGLMIAVPGLKELRREGNPFITLKLAKDDAA